MERATNGCVVFLCKLLCVRIVLSLNVSNLPQGLLQQKVPLVLTTKIWKVMITVEDGSTQWDEVMRVVTRLAEFNHDRMDPWSLAQLLALSGRINHLHHDYTRRQKRGLIDGIGLVANSLFGLATEDQVDDLREKIESNRKWQQKISRWSEDFVIVINKTQTELVRNRELLNNITQRTLTFIDETRLIMTLQQQVHQLELIERRTGAIIDDMEHGLLTELILPRDTLSSIVGSSIPLEWYYRWCTITPLWDKGWVYITHLPVASGAYIIAYELVAFPVWGPGAHMVKLDIARYAALDTRSGYVYEPRNCEGTDPVVCSQGPYVPRGCATAVVTQQAVATVCNVLTVSEEQRCFSLAENELVVVLGNRSTISQVCPNEERPLRTNVERGTYRIQWQPGCRLETPSFHITAALMPIGHRLVAGWYVPQGAIDLVSHFANGTYPSALPPLIPLNFDMIPMPPAIAWLDGIDPLVIGTWTVFVLVVVGICVLLYRRFIHRHCKPCKTLCLARSEPREQTLEETVMPSMDETRPPEDASITFV